MRLQKGFMQEEGGRLMKNQTVSLDSGTETPLWRSNITNFYTQNHKVIIRRPFKSLCDRFASLLLYKIPILLNHNS
jgi:hypothetical protein